MLPPWSSISTRIVEGLDVSPGEIVLVRDHCGRVEVVEEVLLAIDRSGAAPLLMVEHPVYLKRLLAEAPIEALESWDRRRGDWSRQASRALVLSGGYLSFGDIPPAQTAAWQAAADRLNQIEEEMRLPTLIAAIPTARQAEHLGLALSELEQIVMPALAVSAGELHQRIRSALDALRQGQELVLRSGEDCELRLRQGGRPWLADDGVIDSADRQAGAIVSNLPAGSIYTTVIETESEGQVWLPKAGEARDVRLTFSGGRISQIEAESGAERLAEMLDAHTGEPRRISHVGMGLNPMLRRPTGFTILDEHIDGNLFLCLGENRYMGGQNASSLNVDYVIPGATLAAR